MRVNNVFSGRPAYYDRGPTQISNQYNAVSQSPLGATNRWQYTVPSVRKAFVTSMQSQSLRDTVATTAGRVTSAISLTGGVPIFQQDWTNNGLNTLYGSAVGGGPVVLAAGVITGTTTDLSTAGGVTYNINMSAIEYDS